MNWCAPMRRARGDSSGMPAPESSDLESVSRTTDFLPQWLRFRSVFAELASKFRAACPCALVIRVRQWHP